MDICNDPDNKEMNAGWSDNNDEGVKASDEDENIDVCQKSNDSTDNILKSNDKQEDEKLETSVNREIR